VRSELRDDSKRCKPLCIRAKLIIGIARAKPELVYMDIAFGTKVGCPTRRLRFKSNLHALLISISR
jgi:hypothetical protein